MRLPDLSRASPPTAAGILLAMPETRRAGAGHVRVVAATLGTLTMGALAVASCASGDDLSDRQAEVAARGAEVMPFDLEATTHVFTKTEDGGRQVVRALDAGDEEQIALIRQHLSLERDSFARGDYTDPARIHGMDMPGVEALSAGYEDVDVRYAERPDGGELRYATDDPDLVGAIHAWFDRQLMDHGHHAEGG